MRLGFYNSNNNEGLSPPPPRRTHRNPEEESAVGPMMETHKQPLFVRGHQRAGCGKPKNRVNGLALSVKIPQRRQLRRPQHLSINDVVCDDGVSPCETNKRIITWERERERERVGRGEKPSKRKREREKVITIFGSRGRRDDDAEVPSSR